MSQRQGGGGYVQRMEFNCEKEKKSGVGGVRVDLNGEAKLL